MNRTIVEMARSRLHYQQLNKTWWGEALMTAVYLLNRLPNTAHSGTTPHELVYGVKPDLGHLRVFGSRGFVHVDKSRRSKWDSKAHSCIFLVAPKNIVCGMKKTSGL
ncbi:polyprotein [Phytophthora megakarya]|uniref:Polyprotein n=1 Tax=Phytophthora megakarya TaxID=4795 RepID=A0A225VV58_9STRA|nr:polyprotein [Phytophthora megakarya]